MIDHRYARRGYALEVMQGVIGYGFWEVGVWDDEFGKSCGEWAVEGSDEDYGLGERGGE